MNQKHASKLKIDHEDHGLSQIIPNRIFSRYFKKNCSSIKMKEPFAGSRECPMCQKSIAHIQEQLLAVIGQAQVTSCRRATRRNQIFPKMSWEKDFHSAKKHGIPLSDKRKRFCKAKAWLKQVLSKQPRNSAKSTLRKRPHRQKLRRCNSV